jgi:hypothetical protein
MTMMTSFSSKSTGNNTGSRILHSCNSKSPGDSNNIRPFERNQLIDTRGLLDKK